MTGVVESKEELRRRRANPEDTDNETVVSNRANTVEVVFESSGRFSLPQKMNFYDFNGRNVSDLTMSKREDLLENLISILNERKHPDFEKVDIVNATTEELLEILLNIKNTFTGSIFKHYFMCECQNDKLENDKQASEANVDISTLKFTSIEEADENLRKKYKEKLEKASPEVWTLYLKKKYGEDFDTSSITIDEEISKYSIGDNLSIVDKGNVFQFDFFRIKHLIKAKKYVENKYYFTIKQINNRKEHNVPLAESKERKMKELDLIAEKKEKDLISYARALALVSKNSNRIETDEERIAEYENIGGTVLIDFLSLLDDIKFGITDEREIKCNLCGESKKRSLRRELDVLELLPTNTSSEGERGNVGTINIFIGA